MTYQKCVHCQNCPSTSSLMGLPLHWKTIQAHSKPLTEAVAYSSESLCAGVLLSTFMPPLI